VPAGPSTDFRFDRFRLVPGERRLLQDDRPVKLGGRAFDTLLVLVQERERAVPKGELMERVWPHLVVEENNLQVQIAALRKILGQETIATIPARGYQFTLRVEQTGEATAGALEPPRHNLPRPLTSFVGREADLSELARMLERTRLLTLTGIGGCGKTRLAIKLAEAMLPSFSDGVCFVDLAPIAEPERVALSVATALGVREEADKPIEETVVRHLAERQLLLGLDNCEHLLGACAVLAERLLLAASGLRVLVTSREGFGVAGEHVFPVRSLSLPSQGTHDIGTLLESEAVQLFVERAKEVAPEFHVDATNAPAVVEICRRLDGIPLALELAAARLKLLSVEQIRSRLNDRFRLLTGSPRALSRHQTLLATLQWSYEHLEPGEQQWLQRLAVFAGGWTLEAAAAVASETADEAEAVERLARLVDQSLVLVERTAADEPRYGMLETVRQYAQDRLNESGEGAAVRERHLGYFLGFAEREDSNLSTRDTQRWYRRIDREVSNLLVAHAWCDRAPNGTERGLELATNLRRYWIDRSLFALGRQVYAETFARPGADRRTIRRGRALFALGQHHDFSGRFAEAIAPLEEGLGIAQEHSDHEYAANCLGQIAYARAFLGETTKALACVDEELEICRRTGRSPTGALLNRGSICRMRGEFEVAAEAIEEALSLCDREDLDGLHVTRTELIRVAIARGDLRRAEESLKEVIRLQRAMGSAYRAMVTLDVAALFAAAHADWRRAARLQCAFDAMLDRMGGFRNPYDDDHVLAELRKKPRAMLGDEAYAAAYEAGRNVSLEQALSETLTWIEQDVDVGPS